MVRRVLVLASFAILACCLPVRADFDAPAKPKVDCTNSANKGKPACKPGVREASADEVYNAAYWMARRGQYQEALAAISQSDAGPDARILTVQGLATRKLGDVAGALTYYQQAIALNPDSTRTREYLGEAYVAQARLDLARGQLAEIEIRCGRACEEFVALYAVIAVAEHTH